MTENINGVQVTGIGVDWSQSPKPRVFVVSRQAGHVLMMVGVYASYQGAIAAAEKFADGCFTEIIPMEVQA